MSDEHWVTIHGAHVLLDDAGESHDDKGGRTAKAPEPKPRSGHHFATEQERKDLKVPPAWKDVQVANDPKAARVVTGVDAKGRQQAIYSKEHTEKASEEKFRRHEDFVKEHPELRKTMQRDMREGPNKEEAAALRLIDLTGLRVGSDTDTGGRVKAYGISTLQKSHVKVEGDTIHLDFIGKEGIRNQKTVTDAAMARNISERLKQPGDRLFNTSDAKIRDYLHSIDGEFKVKDFRTWHANAVAKIAIRNTPEPKSPTEFVRARKQVAEIVSAHLNNKPAQALASYINPAVFSSWEHAHAV